MGDAKFHEVLRSALARSEHAAAEARSCADDLRTITDRAPGVAGIALQLQGAPTRTLLLPALGSADRNGTLASRARKEIERREHALDGDLRTIEGSVVDGPAALARVGEAVEHADHVQARLCEARDLANDLAARVDAHSVPEQVMSLK